MSSSITYKKFDGKTIFRVLAKIKNSGFVLKSAVFHLFSKPMIFYYVCYHQLKISIFYRYKKTNETILRVFIELGRVFMTIYNGGFMTEMTYFT